MSPYTYKPLGSIADIRSGIGFPLSLQGKTSGRYPFAKVGDISRVALDGRTFINDAEHHVDDGDLPALRTAPIPVGSIILAKIGEAIRHNRRAITTTEMLIDNNVFAITPKPVVDTKFLYHYLRSVDLYPLASSTTVPSIRKTELAQLHVPLPGLSFQRRIAEVLDHVEALREKRRKSIALLDDLAQSIFLDMFGGPRTDELGRNLKLGDIADIQGGLQVTARRNTLPTSVPYLRVANVHRGALDLSEIKQMNVTDGELERTKLRRGDLLVVEGHGNPDEIGRVAVWDGSITPCTHQNHLIRVRVDESAALPEYAEAYLNSATGRRHLLRSAKTTSGLNTISTSTVRSAPILVPPLANQQKFRERILRIESARESRRAGLAHLDTLFSSIQSRAFRGELWQDALKDL